jgi:hypothetical protein
MAIVARPFHGVKERSVVMDALTVEACGVAEVTARRVAQADEVATITLDQLQPMQSGEVVAVSLGSGGELGALRSRLFGVLVMLAQTAELRYYPGDLYYDADWVRRRVPDDGDRFVFVFEADKWGTGIGQTREWVNSRDHRWEVTLTIGRIRNVVWVEKLAGDDGPIIAADDPIFEVSDEIEG